MIKLLSVLLVIASCVQSASWWCDPRIRQEREMAFFNKVQRGEGLVLNSSELRLWLKEDEVEEYEKAKALTIQGMTFAEEHSNAAQIVGDMRATAEEIASKLDCQCFYNMETIVKLHSPRELNPNWRKELSLLLGDSDTFWDDASPEIKGRCADFAKEVWQCALDQRKDRRWVEVAEENRLWRDLAGSVQDKLEDLLKRH